MILTINLNNTPGNLAFVEAELHKRFVKVGIKYVSYLRTKLNRYQVNVKRGKRIYGLDPSAPGEYPKKQSGDMLKSITYNYDKTGFMLNVGSNLQPYPKFLQLGTFKMAPRPWLSMSFNEQKKMIGDTIVNG